MSPSAALDPFASGLSSEAGLLLRTIFNQSYGFLGVLDLDGRLMAVNESVLRISGVRREEVVGRLFWETLWWKPSPEVSRQLRADFRAALGGAQVSRESRYFLPDGSIRFVDRTLSPLLDESGGTLRVIAEGRDITSRKRAQEEITRLNSRLEGLLAERTSDLGAFAYSVSHDLRAPLRGIHGYANILLEDYGGRLDETGRCHLLDLAAQARRMGRLIDDLLAFARVGRQDLFPCRLDMRAMAAAAFEKFHREEQEDCRFELGPLPAAQADPAMIRLLWESLLSNALKFSAGVTPRPVSVRGRRDGDRAVFAVEDSGLGFDMKFAPRLFGVFQRFHDPRHFEGTGVGLALAERIVQRHGGRIWAESVPGRGSCFRFSLPAAGEEGHGA